jgi:methionyl-tRNA formyltransferase
VRIGIFSTETSHHAYFVKRLAESFENIIVITEQINQVASNTAPFQLKVNRHEQKKWFNGADVSLSDFATVYQVDDINSEVAIEKIIKNNFDVVIDFGTRVLKLKTLQVCPENIFNLHGGDPERYRGLDSHLWSIYHGDFRGLVTTIHKLDLELDAGDIISKVNIPLEKGVCLHELRSLNTEVCVDLTTNLLECIGKNKKIYSCEQNYIGRYYSAMPIEMIPLIESKFRKFIADIKC